MNPIQIVGGGIAGLALGIGLRRRGVPVMVLEAGHYPRHRVCGEFISGRGRQVLRDLGVERRLCEAGAVQARSALFCTATRSAPVRKLPEPALCVSRWTLDDLLRQALEGLGAEVRQGTRWQGDPRAPGVVMASGRQRRSVEGRWRWAGLKAHALGVPLAADLEMHCLDNGYIGLCRLGASRVNVCGLFRIPALERGPAGMEWLRGTKNSLLASAMDQAEFIPESFCAVAGLSVAPRIARHSPQMQLGDALAMIPPLTGNGMSLALESAALAWDPIAAFSAGELSWEQTRARVRQRCRRAFGLRLRWAVWVQRLAFSRAARTAGPWGMALSPIGWRILFSRTR